LGAEVTTYAALLKQRGRSLRALRRLMGMGMALLHGQDRRGSSRN
jgi:hypothetical protein